MSKKPEVPPNGLEFPVDSEGKRSSSNPGKFAIAAAIRAAGAPESEKFALSCENEKKWRFKYTRHFMNLVKVSAHSPEAAIKASKAGINYMHSNFDFVDPSDKTNKVVKFGDYMKVAVAPFFTGVIQGQGDSKGKNYVVPYKKRDLSGEDLKKQLGKWAKYGTFESDACDAIGKLTSEQVVLTDHHFILIGAGSAMGPFIKLLEHGATVVAIDVPSTMAPFAVKLWERLIATAKKSSGKLIFPMSKPQAECKDDAEVIASAGSNLTQQPAKILAWLQSLEGGKSTTIGNYTYLDGDLHVKLSLAADSLINGLCAAKPTTSVAFLCTPTDIHCVSDEAHKTAKKNYGYHPGRGIELLINLLSFGKYLQRNAGKPIACADNTFIKVVDGLSVAQGPNYALAKRLQHWRAMVAFEDGHRVSSNIAPSTATASVVSNKTFAWAYGGMPYFKPYEIFQQDTTNALMCALLIADVMQKDSSANPVNRKANKIDNALKLFSKNSMHGGVWRCGYTVDSIGEVSALIYWMGGPKMFLPVMMAIIAAIAFAVLKVLGRL